MIIVDKAIEKRVADCGPIRIALIGAGFSARHIASHIINSFPAIQLAVIVNRTLEHAASALETAGVAHYKTIHEPEQLSSAIGDRHYCVTSDPAVAFACPEIEAVIEATGDVAYGADIALQAIAAGKHIVAANCEVDATVGPLLKRLADDRGVIFTNTDGDEPGVATNLARHVRTMGLEVVGAGNLKGFYDPYRTPATQAAFARQHFNQKPEMVTSFVDGTKLSMELAVTANSLGFGVRVRGMHGVRCDDVRECLAHFPAGSFIPGEGIVDFLVGAAPSTGAFVIAHTEQPMTRDYLKYLKMGEGPFYVFYTPFHLPQLEIPITVCRAVLLHDAAVTPVGRPYADAVTIAKKDLKAGETLDGIGGYCAFAELENFETAMHAGLLPMGVSVDCRLKRDVTKDTPITYADVELPPGRQIDRLRQDMIRTFFQ
ncbi:MAG: NAD(P)-dependent oxidoreductase [Pseudomonadales bacterium]|nr:NAD(P)-dependent oxidoreductase [Pseudomonadales bacterium]